MDDNLAFSCRDTEIVLQLLKLTQQIEHGHGLHAIRHVISCKECTAKGYSDISQKTITCEQAMLAWVHNPNILKHPQTLGQYLALEHFWLKPCTAWMCVQIREHIAPLRLQATETIMNEFGEIVELVTYCADLANTTTQSALLHTQERVRQFLEEICKITPK